MSACLPFSPLPRARASLKAGTLFAIDGGDSFIYFGQVTRDKQIGFFRHRSRTVAIEAAIEAPLMSRFTVGQPSIGEALRAGKWLSLGHDKLRPELEEPSVMVQWPVGTLVVSLWKGGTVIGETMVHDSAIQDLEIMGAHDAVYHVPKRLHADFTQAENAWMAGGTILRERLKKEYAAVRSSEQPWARLPPDWVPVQSDA